MSTPLTEKCLQPNCDAHVERHDGHRCGGVLFGTVDQMVFSCGKFFCDRHLWGKNGPFRCETCHAVFKGCRGKS